MKQTNAHRTKVSEIIGEKRAEQITERRAKHLSALMDGQSAGASPLLTEADTAQFLSCSQVTLRRWRMRGIGPDWVRLNTRSIRYRIADLEAYVAAGRNRRGPVAGGSNGAVA